MVRIPKHFTMFDVCYVCECVVYQRIKVSLSFHETIAIHNLIYAKDIQLE